MRHIGVDLSKRAFTVCFLAEDDSSDLVTYPLTDEGLGAFRAQLAADDRLAVEVGTNAYFFHDQVVDAVAEVVLVSTYQFAVIAKSKKKTDRADAILLARFLKLDYLPRVVMPEPRVRELRHLFTARGSSGEHGPRPQEHGPRSAGPKRYRRHAGCLRLRNGAAPPVAPRGPGACRPTGA